MKEMECGKCHETFPLEWDFEPTEFCNACAHDVIIELQAKIKRMDAMLTAVVTTHGQLRELLRQENKMLMRAFHNDWIEVDVELYLQHRADIDDNTPISERLSFQDGVICLL